MPSTRSTISRAHITAWLIGELEDNGNPVGDGSVPQTGTWGWQGQAGDSSAYFVPWLSVMPGTGRSAATPGSFGDSGSELILSYSVTYNAVNREQVEWLADSTRKQLVNVGRIAVSCGDYGNWKIQQVRSVTIGGILRVRSTDPDFFVQTDAFDVWVSKEQ